MEKNELENIVERNEENDKVKRKISRLGEFYSFGAGSIAGILSEIFLDSNELEFYLYGLLFSVPFAIGMCRYNKNLSIGIKIGTLSYLGYLGGRVLTNLIK